MMVEVPDYLIADIINSNLPDLLKADGARTHKERAMRLAMKATMRLFLGYVEGQIKAKAANLPIPRVPVGDDGDEIDALEYGVYYILALGLAILSKSDLHAAVEETENGTLRVVQLTAGSTGLVEPTDVTGFLSGGKDANAGATQPSSTNISTGVSTSTVKPAELHNP
jgi:hypothetical protein